MTSKFCNYLYWTYNNRPDITANSGKACKRPKVHIIVSTFLEKSSKSTEVDRAHWSIFSKRSTNAHAFFYRRFLRVAILLTIQPLWRLFMLQLSQSRNPSSYDACYMRQFFALFQYQLWTLYLCWTWSYIYQKAGTLLLGTRTRKSGWHLILHRLIESRNRHITVPISLLGEEGKMYSNHVLCQTYLIACRPYLASVLPIKALRKTITRKLHRILFVPGPLVRLYDLQAIVVKEIKKLLETKLQTM